MKKSEAIKEIKRWTGILLSAGSQCTIKTAEAQEMAIQALEEVEQYRATGTVEEFKALKDDFWKLNEMCRHYSAIGTVEELQKMKDDYAEAITDWRQYKKIGTIERFRELTEKAEPKKPIDISKVRDCDGYIGLIGKCSSCGAIIDEDTVYCDCGQRLDWE